MAHDPRETGGKSVDRFGWGQQPLRRVDETTGDEGIEPPVGLGHDEATIGRSSEQDRPGDGSQGPKSPRGPDARE